MADILSQAGLGGLRAQADQWLIQGLTETQIMQNLRATAEWKYRFRAIEEFKKNWPQAPVPSEAEVLAYETQAAQLMRTAGLPRGFYDSPDDFTKWIAGNVSARELSERIELARQETYEFNPEVKAELRRLYPGMGEGDFIAFALDEKVALPTLQKRLQAGQLAGGYKEAGLGQLSVTEAESLSPLSKEQIQAGIGTLVEGKELFQDLPGRGEDPFSRQEQLGAAFGTNEVAQQKLKKRQSQRKATFEGGGTFASSKEGISGLGSA